MRTYELTYIVRPDIDDEAVATAVARVAQTITANGGNVLKTDTSWGKRRLAYPIRRYNEGTYILLYTEMTEQTIREVDRALRLSEDVIRHLLVRAEEVPEQAEAEVEAEAAAPEAPEAPEMPEAPEAPEAEMPEAPEAPETPETT